MNLKEAVQKTVTRLKTAGIPEAQLDAEYLVAEAAGIPRLRLAFKSDSLLSTEKEGQLDRWVRERLERRPLAYVLGEQPFMNLTLRVTPSVLIPRPETELLVAEAHRLLDAMDKATVVDVGTGSGNIVLSLAQHAKVQHVHAVDISNAALEVARENAMRNKIKKDIQWHLGDLLSPLLQLHTQADLIVANLPYVRSKDLSGLSPEVHWEPILALAGGRDGLAYIYQLIAQSKKVLKPGGFLLLEIGFDQGDEVLKALASPSQWKNARLFRDLAGLPRIIRVQTPTTQRKGVPVGSINN